MKLSFNILIDYVCSYAVDPLVNTSTSCDLCLFRLFYFYSSESCQNDRDENIYLKVSFRELSRKDSQVLSEFRITFLDYLIT